MALYFVMISGNKSAAFTLPVSGTTIIFEEYEFVAVRRIFVAPTLSPVKVNEIPDISISPL